MISFRYHLVSVVAVFLALALGIVVGTTALNGPITKDLRSQVNDLKTQRDGLARQVRSLQGQVDDADQFAATYGPQLLSSTMTGKQVLLITLPGVSSDLEDGVTQELAASGAKLSGHLTVTNDYLDQRLGNQITSLATGSLHPVGVVYPETSDARQLGGTLLAYVLLGHGKSSDLTGVLSAFSSLHMIDVAGGDVTAATAIVVLGEGRMRTNSYAGSAELALVAALAKGGGHVVVAGDAASSTGGGLVALVRNSAGEQSAVSTVDDASSAFGQVSSVLALSAAVKGETGHYGTGQGVDALFPSPAK